MSLRDFFGGADRDVFRSAASCGLSADRRLVGRRGRFATLQAPPALASRPPSRFDSAHLPQKQKPPCGGFILVEAVLIFSNQSPSP